jgi:hypothetical protein
MRSEADPVRRLDSPPQDAPRPPEHQANVFFAALRETSAPANIRYFASIVSINA